MLAERLTTFSSVIGESPIWDHRHQTLRWVDIPKGEIHSLDSGGIASSLRVRGPCGCVALASGNRLLAASGKHLVTVDLDGQIEPLVRVAARGTRINDGAVDPQGRMWVGTCPIDGSSRPGALFCVVSRGKARRVVDRVAFSNGIGWSLDGSIMYYIDTGTRRVDAFDFDAVSGQVHDRRTLAVLPEAAGEPDGLTTDASGNLWVALWGGGQILVYDPSGTVVDIVEVPVPNVTSACFGGVGFDRLYITTARQDPADGSSGGEVYTAVPGTTGARSYVFASEMGDPGGGELAGYPPP